MFSICRDKIEKVVKTIAFIDWRTAMDKIENPDLEKPNLYVEKIHIQSVDMFGPRVGFTKFEVSC